ncbi:hypothetical protein BKA70DRAFT_225471 [Coprinopsis sp. MPI-PUGE-AT-0042]|nr:hypothetical protein BKA70DRAFT_225471 [Coprinopsis sp. MPI-PUGE-AT-0042]
MYSTLISVALFAVPALASYAINRPELTQCETARISWPPTKGPYNVIVVAGDEPCGEPLKDLGDITQTFFDWKVDVPAGTVVELSVADSGDAEAWTGNITIKGGDNKACLSGASSSASASAPSVSASSAAGNRATSDTTKSSNTDDKDATPSIVPVGAANAGSNKFLDSGAAPSVRQFSQSAVALGAVAAIAALAL